MSRPGVVEHKVLFLCSYDPLYYTYKYQISGLENSLYEQGIEFDPFYMDRKNYSTEKDLEEVYHFFRERFKNNSKSYEAVILGDDDALLFALEHKKEFFENIPMVFFGVNDLELANKAEKDPYITGFYEMSYLNTTLMTAMKIFPDIRKIYGIHDESAAGKVDAELFREASLQYPDYTFTEIDTEELTKHEIIEIVRMLPDDSILIYMTCYKDINQNHSVFAVTRLLVNSANVPIFRNYAEGRDIGVLGGTYMDFYTQAFNAGKVIVDVLKNGKNISEFKLATDTPGITEYNYPLMQKYGISEKMLPENTVYFEKPVSIFEFYKNFLPLAISITISLVSFILSVSSALILEKEQVKALRASKEQLLLSKKRLSHIANYDELMGLRNRRSLLEHLEGYLNTEEIYSVIMIDIDGFKDINENYGHDVGDKILIDISESLKSYSEQNDMLLGRYGGDEFLMVFRGKKLDETSNLVRGIMHLFMNPFSTDNVNVLLSASIGISNSDGMTPPKQHIINAEIAMYEAKIRGKNMAFVYAEDMKNKLHEENKIKNAILEAFDNDGFYLVYQPKISAKTKKVCGYEALVRIRNSKYGPSAFIPVIEKSGWTTRLGRLITQQAISQLYEWKAMGKEIHPVSINYSSRQINDKKYCNYLRDLLRQYGADPSYLQIEITESLLLEDSSRTKELFDKLGQMKIKLLLDDFGTGYSSLAYLTYVPVEDVKLDKSLVDTYLCHGKEDFIRDVIKLVHDMGKTMTIEGVEHEWQYLKLAEYDADTIQGFYFSKPLDPDKAIDFRVD